MEQSFKSATKNKLQSENDAKYIKRQFSQIDARKSDSKGSPEYNKQKQKIHTTKKPRIYRPYNKSSSKSTNKRGTTRRTFVLQISPHSTLYSEFTDDVVKNINPEHLNKPIEIFKKMGANLIIKKDSIKIQPSQNIKGIKIETDPYPGFPTDLQAQIMALMSIAKGESEIKEKIFENRFLHVPELNRLGAKIALKNDIAHIDGNRKFKGAQVMASDLRASVSLVLAGLCAKGETTINRVYHLDRGYEKIEEILGNCGPKIVRLK